MEESLGQIILTNQVCWICGLGFMPDKRNVFISNYLEELHDDLDHPYTSSKTEIRPLCHKCSERIENLIRTLRDWEQLDGLL